jgi:N-sulfoglucosamine sulfohydrolase
MPIKIVIPLFCLLALFVARNGLIAGACHASDSKSKPNILLIIADDLGIELGVYGDPIAATPRLDALARNGVWFETAWVTAASCSPSRGSIFTGLFPHQNGLIGLSHHGYSAQDGLPTIVSELKGAGYRTGIIGKLHIEPTELTPWDYAYTLRNGFDLIAGERDVSSMAEMARGFLDAPSSKPFFLTVSYYDPHVPFYDQKLGLPERVLTADDVPAFKQLGFDSPEAREWTASYYNCVARLDAGIGLLLDYLDESDRLDNTLIIVIGDHGAPFARTKMTVYDRGLRIPFIMSHPSLDAVGEEPSSYFVSTVDIFPTVLDAAGLSIPENLAGQSLWGLAKGNNLPARPYLFGQHHAHQRHAWFPMRTIRSQEFQLIENLNPDSIRPIPDVDGSPLWRGPEDGEPLVANLAEVYATYFQPPQFELYDMVNDPHAFNNLANDPAYAEIEAELLAALRDWQKETDDPYLCPDYLAKRNEEHGLQ